MHDKTNTANCKDILGSLGLAHRKKKNENKFVLWHKLQVMICLQFSITFKHLEADFASA
jgi:hypothetical protein